MSDKLKIAFEFDVAKDDGVALNPNQMSAAAFAIYTALARQLRRDAGLPLDTVIENWSAKVEMPRFNRDRERQDRRLTPANRSQPLRGRAEEKPRREPHRQPDARHPGRPLPPDLPAQGDEAQDPVEDRDFPRPARGRP